MATSHRGTLGIWRIAGSSATDLEGEMERVNDSRSPDEWIDEAEAQCRRVDVDYFNLRNTFFFFCRLSDVAQFVCTRLRGGGAAQRRRELQRRASAPVEAIVVWQHEHVRLLLA